MSAERDAMKRAWGSRRTPGSRNAFLHKKKANRKRCFQAGFRAALEYGEQVRKERDALRRALEHERPNIEQSASYCDLCADALALLDALGEGR